MALYLTNIAAMHNMRSLSSINAGLDTVYKRLSSGKRINSAKDDPAGLQIADRLTSQINGYKQGCRNLSDGLALAQTMEGALDETTDMLQKIRTLAVQAANGTYDDASRAAINSQVQQLCQEITRIGKKTTFGGTVILDGNQGGFYSMVAFRYKPQVWLMTLLQFLAFKMVLPCQDCHHIQVMTAKAQL